MPERHFFVLMVKVNTIRLFDGVQQSLLDSNEEKIDYSQENILSSSFLIKRINCMLWSAD